MAAFRTLLALCLFAAAMSATSFAEETASMVVADQIPLADEFAMSSEDETTPRKLAANPLAHPPPHHPPPHHPPPQHPPPKHHPPPPKRKPVVLPPSSGPFTFVTCPTYATEYCDFTLEYRKFKIPNFPLSQYKTDTNLNANGPLWNSKTNMPVISASTPGSCFFVPEGREANSLHCAAQFYFGSSNNNYRQSNVIASRVFRPGVLPNYINKCIVMPIATAKLQVAPAQGKTPAKFIFINHGDNNRDYPEARRCVVFTTKNA